MRRCVSLLSLVVMMLMLSVRSSVSAPVLLSLEACVRMFLDSILFTSCALGVITYTSYPYDHAQSVRLRLPLPMRIWSYLCYHSQACTYSTNACAPAGVRWAFIL